MLKCFANQNAHILIKHGSFLYKNYEYTYAKGRALMQMYRLVPQTKRRNLPSPCFQYNITITNILTPV